MTTIVTRAGKGDTLSWVEVDTNFTNLNTDKLEHIVSDTTPQLGGNLDVNGNSIVSTSNANIAISPNGTGKVVLDGVSWPATDGSANQVLTTNGSGTLSWATPSGGALNEFVVTLNASTGSLVSGTIWRYGLTETYDSNNILNISSGAFTLASGNYIFSLMTASGFNANAAVSLILRNETSSTNTFTLNSQTLDASGARCVIFPAQVYVNVGSSTSFAFRGNYGSSNDQFLFDNVTFLVRKVS